jgi:hypothetical protein
VFRAETPRLSANVSQLRLCSAVWPPNHGRRMNGTVPKRRRVLQDFHRPARPRAGRTTSRMVMAVVLMLVCRGSQMHSIIIMLRPRPIPASPPSAFVASLIIDPSILPLLQLLFQS